MQTENLKSFFVWYVITCHLTTYRASRNRFSVISFRDYLRYFGIFLAHYFMKIDRFIFKSSHSFLTLRASWLVWCLYRYYRRNKSRCRFKRDVTIEYLTRTTLETQLTALNVVRIIIFFSGMCLFCWQIWLTLVKSVQTSHQTTRAQSEKTIWRLEIILQSIFIKKCARNIPK